MISYLYGLKIKKKSNRECCKFFWVLTQNRVKSCGIFHETQVFLEETEVKSYEILRGILRRL